MIRRLLDGLYLAAGYAAGVFLIAIFVLMMILSAGRPLGINLPAGDDFAAWCMAATAFLGLAHTFRHGEMIRVGLLIDLFEGQDAPRDRDRLPDRRLRLHRLLRLARGGDELPDLAVQRHVAPA